MPSSSDKMRRKSFTWIDFGAKEWSMSYLIECLSLYTKATFWLFQVAKLFLFTSCNSLHLAPFYSLVSMICQSIFKIAANWQCCFVVLPSYSRAPADDLKCRSSRGALREREQNVKESSGGPADCGKPCDCVIHISKEREPVVSVSRCTLLWG